MLRSVPRSYRVPGGQCFSLYSSLAARPHVLIAGSTGSGKSVTVNGIICNLLMEKSPFSCGFILVDPKKVELIQYADLPHTVAYASEPSDIVRALSLAVEETENRFRTMQVARVREYSGPDLYVIIDELADLMTAQKKETLPLLQRLAQIGRAARVHVIACSQNVMAQTIPTVLKCNFNTIIGLRTATAQQSRFLIASPGCELLPDPKKEGKGYAYIRDGADLQRYQIHMYPDSVIASLVSYWTSPACIAG